MILTIDFNSDNVLYRSKGRIMLKLNYYAEYSSACYLAATKGSTFEDFKKNDGLSNKTVFVGQRGGLSLG